MNFKTTSLFSFIFLYFSSICFGQPLSPKREFRAVWIATINNIDWPSRAGLPVEKQKEEFIQLLDDHKADGMNTIIVQIRPAGDAFYKSSIEPWSQWLTGQQGVPPDPAYDPLEFIVEEAHHRNLELHAWLNPFRAVANINTAKLHHSHISRKKPEWFLNYGILKLFNPGIPEVREYLIEVIRDIVKRYDVDGIHFDDYFYPYPDPIYHLNDQSTFRRYGAGFVDKAEWRRENINVFIRDSYKAIKEIKPWVKFGISPFGVWRNQKNDEFGSKTRSGYTCYDHLHADIRKWVQMGWVDYMAPQLYQNTKHEKNPFFELTEWWNDNAFGRHIYIGHAAYRVHWSSDKSWYDNRELPKQVRFTRFQKNIMGSTFYSSKSLYRNKGGIRDSLRTNIYHKPAIPPAMPWLDSVAPHPPESPVLAVAPRGVVLSWKPKKELAEAQKTRSYIIYRFPKQVNQFDFSDASNILAILSANRTDFEDPEAKSVDDFKYFISSIDRLNNESEPVPPFIERPIDPLIAELNVSPDVVRQLSAMLRSNVKSYFGRL